MSVCPLAKGWSGELVNVQLGFRLRGYASGAGAGLGTGGRSLIVRTHHYL